MNTGSLICCLLQTNYNVNFALHYYYEAKYVYNVLKLSMFHKKENACSSCTYK